MFLQKYKLFSIPIAFCPTFNTVYYSTDDGYMDLMVYHKKIPTWQQVGIGCLFIHIVITGVSRGSGWVGNVRFTVLHRYSRLYCVASPFIYSDYRHQRGIRPRM